MIPPDANLEPEPGPTLALTWAPIPTRTPSPTVYSVMDPAKVEEDVQRVKEAKKRCACL